MKKCKKIALLVITALLTFVFCTGCMSWWYGIPSYDYEALEVISEAELEWTYNEEYREYEVTVKGIAKNLTGKDLDGAGITYIIYDEEGNGIGSAYGYIDFVEADGTWRFYATTSTKYIPVSVKLHEVYGYQDKIFY